MRRARFLPFMLQNLNNDAESDEISDRSYNLPAVEDESTFMDQLNRPARNALRNFDDYEALLNLDDNVV